MTTALYLGRFQPMHNAHLSVIKQILKECDKLIIAIGSSQVSGEDSNPFSYAKRKKIIEAVLDEEEIYCSEKLDGGTCVIIGIEDINDNNKWVNHVKGVVSQIGKFDVVYTGNSLVKQLFDEAGVQVKEIDLIEGYSSTEVRRRIANGEDYSELVPEVVFRMMKG